MLGKIIIDKAFLSTSLREAVAEDGARGGGEGSIKMVINLPPKFKYVTGTPEEKEWILNRGTKLKIDRVSPYVDFITVRCHPVWQPDTKDNL
jgi:hypothetical protein